MSYIHIDNVSVQFKSHRASTLKEVLTGLFTRGVRRDNANFMAIRDVSLSINNGERVGIIGHNGAGKSTLLKTICRIYHPSAGQIDVEGRIAPLLEIGAGFHPEFTGRENIFLNGSIMGFSAQQLRRLEQEIIDFAELRGFIDTPVKYYSTGMYARLAFAVATAVEPDILILDEVFAGGDVGFVEKARRRMASMIDQSSILLFVSHDLTLMQELCDRVIWLDHGEIRADGPSAQIIQAYRETYAAPSPAAGA